MNGTFGAWWVPLRRMVKELGKEVVERELETMDSDIKHIRSIVIDDAGSEPRPERSQLPSASAGGAGPALAGGPGFT